MEFPIKKNDRVGMWVKTNRVLKNGYATMPKGATGLIVQWYKGADLRFEACKCCGASINMSRISEKDLTPIDRPRVPVYQEDRITYIDWKELNNADR